jgi:hypothetical protein
MCPETNRRALWISPVGPVRPHNGAGHITWSASSVATAILHLPVESFATTALRRRSNPMPISIPNYNRKTDRLRLGILIAITSES